VRRTTLIFAVPAVLLLAACTSAPTDYDIDIPGLDPAPTASEEPTSNPWLIEFDHVGPVIIDIPMSELGGRLPGLQIEDYGGGYCGTGYWPDAELPLGSMGVLAESQGIQGPVDRVFVGVGDTSTGEPRTETGIGVGSTRNDVLAAYPGVEESPHTYVQGGSYLDVENGSGLAMRFLTDESGVVDGIIVGRIPQVYYIEGCL